MRRKRAIDLSTPEIARNLLLAGGTARLSPLLPALPLRGPRVIDPMEQNAYNSPSTLCPDFVLDFYPNENQLPAHFLRFRIVTQRLANFYGAKNRVGA